MVEEIGVAQRRGGQVRPQQLADFERGLLVGQGLGMGLQFALEIGKLRPESRPSTQAVNFSSKVFIHIPQHGLHFFAGVEKPGHHRADRAFQRVGDLLVLHPLDLAHQDDGPMLGA